MIQTILAFFGYVKIPKEVILLSIEQENFIEIIIKHSKGAKNLRIIGEYLEAQKTITKFLRSGRLISFDKGE